MILYGLSAVCCKEMKLSDTFDTGNREKVPSTLSFLTSLWVDE